MEWGFLELQFYKIKVVCLYLNQQMLSGGTQSQATARMKDYKYRLSQEKLASRLATLLMNSICRNLVCLISCFTSQSTIFSHVWTGVLLDEPVLSSFPLVDKSFFG